MTHTFTPSEEAAIASLMERIAEDWESTFDNSKLPDAEPHMILFLVRGVADAMGFSAGQLDFPAYFCDAFEPDWDWQVGRPYSYGDHPDIGGGVEVQDADVALDYAMRLDRHAWVKLLGEETVRNVERWALDNLCPQEEW